MTESLRETTAADACMEDTGMMLDWNEYRKQLAAGVNQVGQLSPDAVKGCVERTALHATGG